MPFTHMPTSANVYMENSSISAATLQGTLAAGSMAVARGCVSHPSGGTTRKLPPSSAWEVRVDGRSVNGLWPVPSGTRPCQTVTSTAYDCCVLYRQPWVLPHVGSGTVLLYARRFRA